MSASATTSEDLAQLWARFLNVCGPIVSELEEGVAKVPADLPTPTYVTNAGSQDTYYEWSAPTGQGPGAFADISRVGGTVAITCGILRHDHPTWETDSVSHLFLSMLQANPALVAEGGRMEIASGQSLPVGFDYGDGYYRIHVLGVFSDSKALTRIALYRNGYEIDVFEIRQIGKTI